MSALSRLASRSLTRPRGLKVAVDLPVQRPRGGEVDARRLVGVLRLGRAQHPAEGRLVRLPVAVVGHEALLLVLDEEGRLVLLDELLDALRIVLREVGVAGVACRVLIGDRALDLAVDVAEQRAGLAEVLQRDDSVGVHALPDPLDCAELGDGHQAEHDQEDGEQPGEAEDLGLEAET
jgi:hypothetical protein